MKIFNFENKPLTCITYKGRPAFIAKEIGERLGYSLGGTKLAKLITGKWSEFFQEGKHYTVLDGKDLYDFKQLAKAGTQEGLALKGSSHVMLLFEYGIHMVAIRSQKPEAIRLQEYIAEKVMPQLARDGRFDPARTVDESGQLTASTKIVPLDVRERHRMECEKRELGIRESREGRLQSREERLKMAKEASEWRLNSKEERLRKGREAAVMRQDARMQYKSGDIDKRILSARLHAANEHEIGTKLGTWLTPHGPSDEEQWISCSRLGKELGYSANHIGRCVTAIEMQEGITIRGNPRYTRQKSGVKDHDNGNRVEWDSYLLCQEIADKIRDMIYRRENRQGDLFNRPDGHMSRRCATRSKSSLKCPAK